MYTHTHTHTHTIAAICPGLSLRHRYCTHMNFARIEFDIAGFGVLAKNTVHKRLNGSQLNWNRQSWMGKWSITASILGLGSIKYAFFRSTTYFIVLFQGVSHDVHPLHLEMHEGMNSFTAFRLITGLVPPSLCGN